MKKQTAVLMILIMLFSMAAAARADGREPYDAYAVPAAKADNALADALWAEQQQVYVFKDFADSENHFTQKAKMWGRNESLVRDMDENWREDPHSGFTCIRCEQTVRSGDWGGWLFLNGMLPEGSTVPALNDGKTAEQGLDLSGAQELRFWAAGSRAGRTWSFSPAASGKETPR